MKLSVKFALSMGCMAVLMAIMGLYLIIQMTRINDTATVMSQYRLPLVHTLGEINNAESEVRIAEMLHGFVTDKAEEQNMEKRMADLTELINANLQKVDGLITNPESRRLFNAFLEARKQYSQEAESALKRQDITGLMTGESRRLYSAMEDSLESIIRLAIQDTDRINSEADKMYADSLMIGIILVVGAVLIAVVVTIILVRNTILQLGKDPGELHGIATRVAAGKYDIDDGGRKTGVYAAIVEMVTALKHHIDNAERESANAREQSEKAREAMEQANAASEEAQVKTESMLKAADKLEQVVNIVSSASTELSAQVEQSGRGAEQQASVAADTATAMEEMTATVLEVAKNASMASDFSAQTRQKAEEGAQVVHKSVESIRQVQQESLALKDDMGELSQHAQSISQIMSVISDIADQTNLLALNAAIEAARAGDAGRGFAVVADEVRKLAEKTMTATKEVSQNILAIQEDTRSSIEAVEHSHENVSKASSLFVESRQALETIVTGTKEMAEQIALISTGAQEQSTICGDVVTSLTEINAVAVETSAAMQHSAEAVTELVDQAHQLGELVTHLRGDEKP